LPVFAPENVVERVMYLLDEIHKDGTHFGGTQGTDLNMDQIKKLSLAFNKTPHLFTLPNVEALLRDIQSQGYCKATAMDQILDQAAHAMWTSSFAAVK
jgi:hypothetical protein